MTEIVVNEELKAYIDPMTTDEYEALERSILAEGCRDALVLWGNILVDGHHRYSVCRKHDLPFQTIQNTRFQSMEDVHLWMIEQHLGRRSVSPFQRGVLALRKREILAKRRAQAQEVEEEVRVPAEPPAADAVEPATEAAASPVATAEPLPSREELAREARLSQNQVGLIEKIHKQATEEVVAAVKSGVLSINAAAAVASLPAEEQRAAAEAGEDELKNAAKRVRESRRRPRKESKEAEAVASVDALETVGEHAEPLSVDERQELLALREQVAELTAENEALRKQLADLQG
ncbi:plasmid replication/partition related protein [Dyella sp. BiH032]|uniref:plasmid replication/partition related protein n=1 Tax=Dyella sp. BiH032 TaxID=3075430 RepID=UPI0028936A36|nr:plasmid replication/partition related protein [Dyella sp. BiH032]WNL44067.1 plasmid replication/partition related protein [Dyella sp. BiH032]